MQALIFNGRALKLRDVPRPRRRPGEALIRVLLAGICNTDLEIVKGYMGFMGVLGHEFVGVVERAHDESLIGKRVVGEINAACGRCTECRAGLGRHCHNRTVLGIQGRSGAFAEYLTLPEQNLHVVPEQMPDETAVFVEPAAAALEILEQVQVKPTDRVLVIGDGKLGLLAAQALAMTGAMVSIVGKHPENLKRLRDRRIQRKGLHKYRPRPVHDIVVEASGSPSGWDLAVASTRPKGTLVLKSTYAGAFDFNPAPLVINEITVVGSRCGPFMPALAHLASGQIRVAELIDSIYPLDRAREAFTRAGRNGVLKVLLMIGAPQ